ncbi:ubiquitin carboxyl-terminal hydrolase 13 isoform X4 [Mastomys coucha]|uniref:ubiquitin carboxyl-terminal hydrolase 13 isoform X4 n=1 Tax=Mastomys coucha TaxID=35658 RepID=UPI001261D2C3|nr:ubiquitin carboxyl-terminal hydrolase 13 isoform X4 [Mastomys coucha]
MQRRGALFSVPGGGGGKMAAGDLGELLVPHMPTIRVPRSGDRVYKNECAFSYDSPNSEGGLYVCMNTFLAFGREHVERHFRKTGQSVYMHLKRHMREKIRGASGGALPKRRNSKIFLDLDMDDDLNSDDYEYEDEAKLVIFPDHYEIALPNIEELPALVTIACDAVLSSKSPYRKQDPDTWENEVPVSKYANNLVQLDNGVRIPPSGWKCARCDLRENLWLNLTDGSVLCGKWFFDSSGGNGHALEHYKDMGYPLAVKLGTITPDGADVYSFQEEGPVSDPHLAKHLAHFGIDMLHTQGTENGLRDNDVKPRVSEWEVIQESGTKLKPMYGPGYTGLKNLGNSCYLSSVMQAIFSIPEFQRAYVGNLPRIFDYSPLDPTQDFNTQMTKLGHGLLSGQYSKPPVKSELIEQVMKEEHKPQQNGISPRMFKAFVSKSHPEFSSNRQQDAQEFFLHLVNLVERNRIGSENPSDVFRFLVEERIQCCQTRKVRYTERVDYLMQLPVAMEAATNKDVSIDMPDLLDISHLRARGLQPGEEELPDISPPIVIPDDSKDRLMNQLIDPSDIDESSVMQLAEMGFPLEACRKAVYFTGNTGAEVAFNWIIVHMEEPDFAEPLAIPGYGGAGASVFGATGLDNQPPEEIVAIITSMGFQRNQAVQALQATSHNLERALDWIFSHPEFEEDSDFVIEMENNANANIMSEAKPEGPRVKDGSGMYELFAFISHMGTSTMSGHYVCHIKKEGRWVIYNDHKVCASERPPKDLGYMYFYRRIPS